jgi:transmembrane sensor
LSKGNAFFDVARNKKIPFVVQLNQSIVKVLGTEFNIALSYGKVELSVNEGAVLFQPELVDTYAILTAGKGLIYDERSGSIDSVDVTNKNADSWLTGKLKFTDASLVYCKL